jgi:hypothetical protein
LIINISSQKYLEDDPIWSAADNTPLFSWMRYRKPQMTSIMINMSTPSFELELSGVLEIDQSVPYTYLKVLHRLKKQAFIRVCKIQISD